VIHGVPIVENSDFLQNHLAQSRFEQCFIGLGAQEPTAEWGAMVASGRDFLLDQWWYPTFPGMAILVTAVGFNLLGDGLRDIFDPRLRGK